MLKTLELPDKSPAVKSCEVLDFKKGKDFYYLKIRAVLIDVLHIREYVSPDNVSYSYNWIDKNGNIICRWDSAPRYKNIKTFPHHKHTRIL